MDQNYIKDVLVRRGRKEAAEVALASIEFAHLAKPILAHEWPPVEGRTSGPVFKGESDDDETFVVGNLKSAAEPLASNGDSQGTESEYNLTAFHKAVVAALKDKKSEAKAALVKRLFSKMRESDPATFNWVVKEMGDDRWDVVISIAGISNAVREANAPKVSDEVKAKCWAKALSIAIEIARLDPSSRNKWIVDKVHAGDWDPDHKSSEREDAGAEQPKGFDASNTPRFLLAKAIKRHGAFNGAAAQDHARALNARVKAAKYGDNNRWRRH